MFIGLNPSTADEKEDDPTIRRCIRFAEDWGCGTLCMVNLFAVCATEPKEMLAYLEPVGPDNDTWILGLAQESSVRVAAWGGLGGHLNRDRKIVRGLKDLKCLRLTKGGFPWHPLYIPADTKLMKYNPR